MKVTRPSEMDADAASFDEVREITTSPPRKWTLSMALPGSILDNAQSPELRATLACQIARAAAIFCVDEVVIFREGPTQGDDDSCDALALYLSYLDTPQYLRRHLFPRSEKLRYVGLLNPLNLPNHFAKDDTPRWRDGVAVPPTGPWSQGQQSRRPRRDSSSTTHYVDVGQQRLAEVDRDVQIGERVTVDLASSGEGYAVPGKHIYGQVVPRSAPREVDGVYWGYAVRMADSLLSALARDGEAGYDLVIGTSDRGFPINGGVGNDQAPAFALPSFSHALVVFGGVAGLEYSAQCDERLAAAGFGVDNPDGIGELFDFYVNSVPDQGSRTIRTEEAIPITLASLRPHLRPKHR